MQATFNLFYLFLLFLLVFLQGQHDVLTGNSPYRNLIIVVNYIYSSLI